MSQGSPSLGIIVNPMSGRDVRRVMARASTSAHQEKQQQVARLIVSALQHGVDRIFLGNEPFRIGARASENLAERDRVRLLDYPLTHTARDTETMAQMMWDEGCRTFIVLGGDGTSRIVARKFPDAILLPLSTGTNNVFPFREEATIAGAAAALVASGRLAFDDACTRCKRIIIDSPVDPEISDIALIDAVVLHQDVMGSFMPFEGSQLGTLILTRAEPGSVGMSPIGGYLEASTHLDNWGMLVECDASAADRLPVPLSPGLWQDVGIKDYKRLPLGMPVALGSTGILAFDGDRSYDLAKVSPLTARVERDGPWIIDPQHIMRLAMKDQMLLVRT
jgi:hypothetical protein